VGPVESHREKEGTILFLRTAFQDPFGILRQHRVGVVLVAFRRGIPAQGATVLTGRQGEDRPLVDAVDPGGVELKFPRTRIIMTVRPDRVGNVVMIEFADPAREVTLEPEGLRQADRRGNRLAEDERIRQDARAVRVEPRQHRVPARPAERKGAVSLLEANPARGESVDVRRLRLLVSIAAEVVVEVVGDEEEHVRPVRRRNEAGQEQEGESEEGSVHGRRG
jgi:hypothetical protein